jgi:hypothetical protein
MNLWKELCGSNDHRHQARIQRRAPTLFCKKIFEIDREIWCEAPSFPRSWIRHWTSIGHLTTLHNRVTDRFDGVGGLHSQLQRGPKVTSLVARSSRGWCAQHLRRIRWCDVCIRRESDVNLAHTSSKCYAQNSRTICLIIHVCNAVAPASASSLVIVEISHPKYHAIPYNDIWRVLGGVGSLLRAPVRSATFLR